MTPADAPPPGAPPPVPPAPARLTRRDLALVAAFWTFHALLTVANRLFGAGTGRDGVAAGGALAVALTESLCWALLTPLVFQLAGRGDADRQGALDLSWDRVAAFLAVGAVASVGLTWVGHEMRGLVRGAGLGGPPPGAPPGPGGAPGGPPFVRGAPPWIAFANALLTYVGIYAAGLARAYSLRYRARREQAMQLQAQLAEARLDALRRQLDPHFLFNTLNAVSALVERDPKGVRRMIARLSDLLRHSFEGPDDPEVPLRDELALVGRYVEIMQVRFQGRLAVDTRADERALDALVPSMLLQPLVENAIKHGVERRAGAGRIAIEAVLDGGTVVLRVVDDGPGPAAPDAASGRRGGVGLRNTRARLQELYGAAQALALSPAPGGGTVAEVRLPFHTRETTSTPLPRGRHVG
jgi:type II secretory pathway pseudopilin PulG